MKFSVVVLLVVLAVSHSTEAGLVKRDAKSDLNKLIKFIDDMSTNIASATQDMVERVRALEVTNTAQTYMEDSKTKILPLIEKVQADASRLQDQVKPFIANIEGQIKPIAQNFTAQVRPLTQNLSAQVRPLSDMMEKFFQQVMDQTKALMPPQ